MSKYATEQRASVGRTVIYKGDLATQIAMLFVIAIDEDPDLPILADAPNEDGFLASFFDAKTEDDLERMPIGCWTWPPRV